MDVLTPEERRGALLVLGLILIGAGWDATRGRRVAPPPPAPDVAHVPGGVATPFDVAGDRAVRAGAGDPADSAAGARVPRHAAPVSLNRATADELEALPGIGPVLARRIVEHRARAGAFRSIEELRAVRGVGPRLLARLRGHVDL